MSSSSSSSIPMTVAGALVERIMENGDREEEYSWEVQPTDCTISSRLPLVLNLPTPFFPRGALANPFWRQKLKATYSALKFTFEFPYPDEPSSRDWEWRLLNVSVQDLALLHHGILEVKDGEGGLIGSGPPTAWRKKKMEIVKASVRDFLDDREQQIIVTIKIFGKRRERNSQGGDSDSDSDSYPRDDKKRVKFKFNPIISATFNSPELSDFQVVCQGETFHCHKLILSVGTPVFKRMFLSESKENQEGKVTIEDMAKDILVLMLAWMYGEDISDKLDTLQTRIELYKAADRYLLEKLKESLVIDILSSVKPETAFDIYVLGDTLNEEGFKREGIEIMKRKCSEVFSNDVVFDECQKRYPRLIQEILMAQRPQ